MNKFITTNPVTKATSVNYVEVNSMMKSLSRAITTIEEYRTWVREFRAHNASLVEAIQYFRSERKSGDTAEGKNRSQLKKLSLRPFATSIYELRAELKARAKAGEFTKTLETV